MSSDRKKFDGALPDDEAIDGFVDPTANFVPSRIADPVPPLLENLRTTDPKEYGTAVLQLLEQAAFVDIGEFMTWGGRGGLRLKSSEELTPGQRRLVRAVKEDKDGNLTLELVSKDQAIRLLGQASGVLRENVEHSGKVDIGLMDVLKAVDGRTRGLPPKTIEARPLEAVMTDDDSGA